MGLLNIIKKVKQKEKEVRVLMVGLDNAGKTTIVKRLNGEDITTISPTLGFNIMTMTYKGYKLNIWDIGGQKTLRPYWRNYYEKTDALIWVVDASDFSRLKDCRDELHNLLKEERLFGASLLIFANKQDIPTALPAEELEKALRIGSITKRHCRVVNCSAVDSTGLLEGFDFVVKDISSRIYLFS
ncbi:ADP-ribosylation factor-like protein 2 [Pleodorina starrii]|uniref:ADP-ribosylation factor-like protein 2 n=1 Tax=Pleodorina starrii TaxID=330485 RepID=A0A9W6BR33_9CHLO|nr:ADP-ribosylation factor-like protein 2 [Pleodorina starrii]GLC56395.1 ADP-ribosylation factor-like protein 2 [Pleodorina starrii]GLC69308.1 ADP-ribosylation factor-like protein 2 [Pleodorina starrii]